MRSPISRCSTISPGPPTGAIWRSVLRKNARDRSADPFALLLIDLDGFKAVNDTHGHAAGDACLQHFALMAQTRLRPGDMLARAGGDEFCIVLPASTLREAAVIARRVLQVCRHDAEASGGRDIPIAVSIGIAQWTFEIALSPEPLIL